MSPRISVGFMSSFSSIQRARWPFHQHSSTSGSPSPSRSVRMISSLGFVSFECRGEFLWDDDFYVTNNTALKRPDGIERIWLHNPKGGFLKARDYPVPQFYPMTHTSFWVQTRGHDWSMPLASWPFHLVNVLLHFA